MEEEEEESDKEIEDSTPVNNIYCISCATCGHVESGSRHGSAGNKHGSAGSTEEKDSKPVKDSTPVNKRRHSAAFP